MTPAHEITCAGVFFCVNINKNMLFYKVGYLRWRPEGLYDEGMKIVKVDKKGKESLYTTILVMTMIPLLIFGVFATIFISFRVGETKKAQIAEKLKDIAITVENAYDVMYPGDYQVLKMKKSTTLYKGGESISADTALIDRIKSESDIDVSFFFADIRLATTLTDENGERLYESAAADTVANDVFIGQKDMFYDNVTIDDDLFFAYYMPIYNNDGTCFGMIGVATPVESFDKAALISILQTVVILVLFMIVTAVIIVRSSSKIMIVIVKILEFLRDLSNDKLDARLEDIVLNRKDELGEIGLASSKLQVSLKKLIERDALTGLFNRRAGEKKLDGLLSDGISPTISIGDIDFFKKFNDNFGHECGDVVLKEVAKCLNDAMKGQGFAARWGGEEFLLVFEKLNEKDAAAYIEGILDTLRNMTIEYDGNIHFVTMTFGVAGRNDNEKISEQIRRADAMLYEGKETGRNRVIHCI